MMQLPRTVDKTTQARDASDEGFLVGMVLMQCGQSGKKRKVVDLPLLKPTQIHYEELWANLERKVGQRIGFYMKGIDVEKITNSMVKEERSRNRFCMRFG